MMERSGRCVIPVEKSIQARAWDVIQQTKPLLIMFTSHISTFVSVQRPAHVLPGRQKMMA